MQAEIIGLWYTALSYEDAFWAAFVGTAFQIS